jgi:hypothetical protein
VDWIIRDKWLSVRNVNDILATKIFKKHLQVNLKLKVLFFQDKNEEIFKQVILDSLTAK